MVELRRDVEELLRQVASDDPELVERGLEALAARGRAVVEELGPALVHHDPRIRGSAVLAAGQMPFGLRGAFLPHLKERLRDESRDIRLGAVEAIRMAANEPEDQAAVAPALLEALSSEDVNTLRLALTLAARVGPVVAPVLTGVRRLLDHQDPLVAVRAGHAVAAVDRDAAGDGLQVLTRSLGDLRAEVRCAALEAIAALGVTAGDTADAVARCLFDGVEEVRSAAAFALERVASSASKAVPALKAAATDPDPEVAEVVVDALCAIGAPAAGALVELFAEAQDEVARERVREALEGLDDDAVGGLLRALDDPRAPVRLGAVLGLANRPRSPEAAEALRRMVTDPSPEVQRAARNALGTDLHAVGVVLAVLFVATALVVVLIALNGGFRGPPR
jgi:HEAT repeat protein